ncbi:serine hydrolase domain-containing protein [Sorangium sp. So ce1128]
MNSRLLGRWALRAVICVSLSGCAGGNAVAPSRQDRPAAPMPAPSAPEAKRGAPVQQTFPKGDPGSLGINPAALEKLVQRAEASHSDGLVLVKNGKLVGEWYFGKERGPIEAMSVTKSIVNLAIGRLVDSGRVRSVDMPLHEFFPPWKNDDRRAVTLLHVLNHTSGLKADANAREVYASADFVKLAVDAPLTTKPGEAFFYNNKAVNLLAAVVQSASGQRLDQFMGREIFTPLGITDFSWSLDKAGNPHVMAGLQIHPLDLAKLGELVLEQGSFQGKRILSKAWVERSTAQSQPHASNAGLLWWRMSAWSKVSIDGELLDAWRRGGVPEADLGKLAPLKGQLFESEDALAQKLMEVLGGVAEMRRVFGLVKERKLPLWKASHGPVIGFHANGFLGQYLIVLPEAQLVAVRMTRGPAEETEDPAKLHAYGMSDFTELVRALVR